MDRVKTADSRISTYGAKAKSALSRRAALTLIGVVSTALLCVVTVAPAPIALALTLAVAAPWCAWLERHPEARLLSTAQLDIDTALEQ
jgi:hypothetical protein